MVGTILNMRRPGVSYLFGQAVLTGLPQYLKRHVCRVYSIARSQVPLSSGLTVPQYTQKLLSLAPYSRRD